jgi:hypothetical protein
MHFTHRNEPGRVATFQSLGAGTPAPFVVVEYDDPAGKRRKKTFKKPSEISDLALRRANDAALSFLLREGFVVQSPQDGPLQWLTYTEERFLRGYVFTINRVTRSTVVGDTGYIRRIDQGTCRQVDVALGRNVVPRAVASGVKGDDYALLEIEAASELGAGPWMPPSSGAITYSVAKVVGSEPKVITSMCCSRPGGGGPAAMDMVLDDVSVTSNGDVFGPHPSGAALYAASGEVLVALETKPSKYNFSHGGISPDGRSIAVTAGAGAILFADVKSGKQVLQSAGLEQVFRISVRNDGSALISGARGPSWGLFRLDQDGSIVLLSANHDATLSPDGKTLIEIDRDIVRLREAGGAGRDTTLREEHLSLGVAKRGHAEFLDDDFIVVQTDTHILAGIDLTRLSSA